MPLFAHALVSAPGTEAVIIGTTLDRTKFKVHMVDRGTKNFHDLDPHLVQTLCIADDEEVTLCVHDALPPFY